MERAVFLDRDGVLIENHVINGRPIAIAAGETPQLISGVEAACERLRALGLILVMVTNQPDVATRRTPVEFVERTNTWLAAMLRLNSVEVCFHDDTAACTCRKPKPGMLLAAADRLDIDLPASFMVGDRWRDVGAGQNAGCFTVFIDYGYADDHRLPADHVASSLSAAVDWIADKVKAGTKKVQVTT